jgi:hypothetical protein
MTSRRPRAAQSGYAPELRLDALVRLPMSDLQRVFARIGFKPGLMRDLVKSLSAEGRETLDALSKVLGAPATVAKVRAPVERLRRAGLVTKAGSGPPAIDTPLFAECLHNTSLERLE